jgi:two-component system response regulator NreC
MADSVRVLIADDHAVVRLGVRQLLDEEPDFEVVGEAVDGSQTLSLVESLQPDVVLMDIAMPGMDGLQATREIKARWPDVDVLVLTVHRSDKYFFEMLQAGASGYVLKGAEIGALVYALRVVSRGEVFIYPTMAQQLVRYYLSRAEGGAGSGPSLSPREKEILGLLAEAHSTKEIAEKLSISPSTVHSHRANLMSKLDLSSRRELIQYAQQRGFISDI